MTAPFSLWSYQSDMLDEAYQVCSRGDDLFIESPTGSGKTLMLCLLLHRLMGRRAHHAIITVPMGHIEDGFTGNNGLTVQWTDRRTGKKQTAHIPQEFTRLARGNNDSTGRAIRDYLNTPKPGHILACTHAALREAVKRYGNEVPEDLSGMVLAIDEAHHAPAVGLQAAVDFWRKLGGHTIKATATPYRGDGQNPRDDHEVLIRRTLAEHMASGHAPRHLEHEIVALGRKGDKVTNREFNGEAFSPDEQRLSELVKRFVEQWEKDGRPKLIVRVPPLVGGSAEVVQRIVLAFRKKGARVFDATGVGKDRQRAFTAMLRAERGRKFADSEYDIVIGIHRVLEATDWPVCSHVYCVGIPSSIQAVVQLLGRATRRKEKGHPLNEKAKITFFVPVAGGDALKGLSLEHSRHALTVVVHLVDCEFAESWIVHRAVSAGATGAGVDIGAEEGIDVRTAALIKGAMVAVCEENPEITTDRLIEAIKHDLPEISAEIVNEVVLRVLAVDPVIGADIEGKIEEKIKEGMRTDSNFVGVRRRVFEEILSEFRKETLVGGSLERIGSQLHGLTAGGMNGFVRRLVQADGYGSPLTWEMIRGWVSEWRQATGEWPHAKMLGLIPGTKENWAKIHMAITLGLRGLPKGQYRSLSVFIAKEFNIVNRTNKSPLSFEGIKLWCQEYRAAEGDWPTAQSGRIPGTSETWQAINGAIARGHRGLQEGVFKSLADFIKRTFGDVECDSLLILGFSQIKTWCEEYRARHGNWPKAKSAIVSGMSESWSEIDRAIRLGLRGLPKGQYRSLSHFIDVHFRNKPDAPLKPPLKLPKPKSPPTPNRTLARAEAPRETGPLTASN